MQDDPDMALQNWLDSGTNREVTGNYNDCKLDPVRRILNRLPQTPQPITIAGTKGKGSTLRFLEQALLAAGRQTTSFTSPHVRLLRERWRLDGKPVSADLAWEAALKVKSAEHVGGERLTYFERCFALACILASDRPDALFLLEVGIGGRLDCANTLDAQIAIVTHIGFDHCRILGHSLAAIAREKSAIARPGRPLLISHQSLLKDKELSSAIPAGVTAHRIPPLPTDTPLGLAGTHQLENAATALAAFRLCCPGLNANTALNAFADTNLAARCQLVVDDKGRRILVDAAHHDTSIAATLTEAEKCLRPGWICLLGLAKDKEIDRILKVLPPIDRLHRCAYDWHRSFGEHDWPPPLLSCPWHPDIKQALSTLPIERDICILGSFYLAGEALSLLTPDSVTPG